MNVLNRLLISLIAIILIAAGIVVILVAADLMQPNDLPGQILQSDLERASDRTGTELAISYGVGALLIAIGIVLLAAQIGTAAMEERPTVLVSAGDEGTVRIARDSIRELAERTAASNRSVRSVDCEVEVEPNGLRIPCEMTLDMGSEIPSVVNDVQSSVKDVVERLTGLPVVDVSIEARYAGGSDQPLLAR